MAEPWQPPQRPRWVERLNAHGDAAGGAHRLVSLESQELIDTACASTGLEDFGSGDWRKHFDVLTRALERESSLHLAGRILTRTELLRSLRNRLQLTALWKNDPTILDRDAFPVTFIVGSPRTGTSILHEVLAQDPRVRAPSMWEMLHPVEAINGDDLRATGDDTTRFWHDVQPEYETMHANSGDLPNECIFITKNEFLSDAWGGPHIIPSYEVHLVKNDHRPAYRFHRDFLKTIQQRLSGERWLLKAPSHLAQLVALFAVYPNARIIQTHRDPLKTLPSTLSLLGTLKWMRCEKVDIAAFAPLIAAGQAATYEREIGHRADGTLPNDRFIDVQFAELMADPRGMLRTLYDRLGWQLSDSTERRMLDYLENKPRGSHGVHQYSLEAMGLDPSEERDRFARYTERFVVPEEA